MQWLDGLIQGVLLGGLYAQYALGMALMFGTAGLPHILMRFFTVPNAKEARKSVLWATTWIGYFYILTFIIGFGAITFVLTNPGFLDAKGGLIGGGHPVGATGVRMILDAYKQVTGQAGEYQVAGARTVATLNIGGSTTTCASFVVGAA